MFHGITGSSIRDHGGFVVQGGVLTADPGDDRFGGSPPKNPPHRLSGTSPHGELVRAPWLSSPALCSPQPFSPMTALLTRQLTVSSKAVWWSSWGPQDQRWSEGQRALGGAPVTFNTSAWEVRHLPVSPRHSFIHSLIRSTNEMNIHHTACILLDTQNDHPRRLLPRSW